MVEQFPDLRQGEAITRVVTVPAGQVVYVPLGRSSRGVRVLTSLTDLRVAANEAPEAVAAAGANVYHSVNFSGSPWAPANGEYVLNADGRYYLNDDAESGYYFEDSGGGWWYLWFEEGGSFQVQYVPSAANASGPDPGTWSSDANIDDPDDSVVAAGSAVQSASAGAVGGAIAADSWEVRLIDNSERLALYSATGGSATVEAF